MKQIFVDTSAWVALFYKRDARHAAALSLNQRLLSGSCHYVTSNFVFDETVTLLGTAVNRLAAIDFGERLLSSKLATLVRIDDELEQSAWRIYKQYHDKLFSFTDCTSFALMRLWGISEAFTHDHHFSQFGFNILLRD
ncbi:MAG: PIN domain-containing protein [Anaerolineae bacterium]|nr:PIN domain-containing protein [Anaerolineae bacterium]